MNSALPPDPANWPTDPYQLLGVGQDAELRDIRRAYARLTKLYRPDHSPKEFQLVRAAYDRGCAWQEFRAQFRADKEDESEQPPATEAEIPVSESLTTPVTQSASGAKPAASKTHIPFPRDSLADGFDTVRRLIREGEFVACHDLLIQLIRDYPDHEEVRFRLCWLRTFFPDLSPEHDPIALLAGDSIETLSPRAWRVLLRFLDLNPETLLSPRVERWLQRPIPPYPLTQLLEMRWKRAARTSRFATIMADLERLKDRLTRIGTGNWLSVVLIAMRITRWFPDQDVEQLWDGAHEEFRTFEDESLTYARLYDEHEWLLEVRESIQEGVWRAWKGIVDAVLISRKEADAWLAVLQTSSVATTTEWRRELEAVLAPWVLSPDAGLKAAEELCHRYPALAAVVHQLLQSIPAKHVRSPHLVARAELSLNFAHNTISLAARPAKLSVLSFCVDEAVDLRELTRLLADSRVTLYQFIYEDPALELAVLATRRFWELPTAELG